MKDNESTFKSFQKKKTKTEEIQFLIALIHKQPFQT